VNGVPAGKLWAQQLMLAKQAVSRAETPAALEDILSRVKKKIGDRDMDPHHIGEVEAAVAAQLKQLKQQAAKHSPKEEVGVPA
jgi:hypothetical protein